MEIQHCQRIQTLVNLPKPNHIYKNVLVKKYRSHCLVHAFLPVEQMHFRNYCLDFPEKFSCAIDCFMELSCYIFKDAIESVGRNEFFEMLYTACV